MTKGTRTRTPKHMRSFRLNGREHDALVADNVLLLDYRIATIVTTKPQGMGMGLSVCRSIVQAHGGTIGVTRGRASGAAFEMAIPPHVRTETPARGPQSITFP
jgi:light-regulated signal transduction histidine kinase (bacteriophytochrome)